tara:strand:- start:969 stop:2348 length:1380 start_codon:yes stop_codon:yes gene_type:complete
MKWKLSQDTVSKEQSDQLKKGETPVSDFGHSERQVPIPELTRSRDPLSSNAPIGRPDEIPEHAEDLENSDDEFLRHYDQDIKNALNAHQVFSSARSMQKGQVYVKLWDRRLERLNLNYFAKNKEEPPLKLDAHFQTIVKQYFRRYPHAIYENLWFSQETQSLFSNAQTYCTGLDPIAHSFCTTRTNFVNQTWNGISSEMGRMIEDLAVMYNSLGMRPNAWGVTPNDINSGKCYGDIVFPDLRFGLCPAIQSICNQDSVLIIGGGPSTNKIDFSKYKDIPVWTMNNYFQNPVFDQFSNIQAACFLDEVDVFDNEKLWKYVNDRDTRVFQEITDFGEQRIKYIKERAPHSTYFHTRYRSKLGVGPRMLITAILLGTRNVYFAGFDGYSVDGDDNHAFEAGKSLPNWMKNSRNPAALQRDQYVMLFDYLLNDLKLKRPFRLIDLAGEQGCDVQYEFLQRKIR